MPTIAALGTQTAVIGTEQTLSLLTTANVYVLVFDTNSMVLGDIVEARIYVKVLSSSTSRVAYYVKYSGAQDADDKIKLSVPVPVMHEIKATLKQTAGVARAFQWELLSL